MERSKPTKRGGSPVLSSRRKRRSILLGLTHNGERTPKKIGKEQVKDLPLSATPSRQFGEDSFIEGLNFEEMDSICSVPDEDEVIISSELPVMSPHRRRMCRLSELSPHTKLFKKKQSDVSYRLRNTPISETQMRINQDADLFMEENIERTNINHVNSVIENYSLTKRNILKGSNGSNNELKEIASPDIFGDENFCSLDTTVQNCYGDNNLCDKEIEFNDFEKDEITLTTSTQISKEINKPSSMQNQENLQKNTYSEIHNSHNKQSNSLSSPQIQTTQNFMMMNMKRTKLGKKSEKNTSNQYSDLQKTNKTGQALKEHSKKNHTMKNQNELSLLERAQLKKQEFKKKFKNSQENLYKQNANSGKNISMDNDSMKISPVSSAKPIADATLKISPVSSGKQHDHSFISPPPSSVSSSQMLVPTTPKTPDSQNSMISMMSTPGTQPLVDRLNQRKAEQSFSNTPVRKSEGELRAENLASMMQSPNSNSSSQASGKGGFQLGPFYGLPSKVAQVLMDHRGINSLYKWQDECIKEGMGRSNLLFSLPTSGGKTLVAEILIFRQLLLRNKDVVFILPYVAIVQEKVRGLSPFGVELGFLVEEYAGSRGGYPPKKKGKQCRCYVSTIEKGSGLVNSLLEQGRIDELGMVVVDEAHMIGEKGGRGGILEATLTKLRFAAPSVQLVAMSATIGNLKQLSQFLGAKLYSGDFRPVELKEYVKIGSQVSEVNTAARTDEELIRNDRQCSYSYNEKQKKQDLDQIGGLVGEVVPDHSCLVFCPTRRNCEALAILICSILPRELTQLNRSEKMSLFRALEEEGGGTVCPVLWKTLPYGIAYHHSGLTEGERRLLEEGFSRGTLCCITCTSTLAAGVNLPARRVIIRSPYVGRDFLSRAQYKQMIGRAGRAGLDTHGESILILQPRDMQQARELLLAPLEVCSSRLLEDDAVGLINFLFSAMGLNIVVNIPGLTKLASYTLMALQTTMKTQELHDKVEQIVEELRNKGLARIKSSSSDTQDSNAQSRKVTPKKGSSNGRIAGSQASSNKSLSSPMYYGNVLGSQQPSEDPVQNRLEKPVSDKDIILVSRLGKAAIKGNIELDLAARLYDDLLQAREGLAVHCYLHLLYLVIPYDAPERIPIIPDVFYSVYTQLGRGEQKVANMLGITDGIVVKISMGQKVKRINECVISRFYVALLLYKLWSNMSVWEASEAFQVHRGLLQATLTQAASFASRVYYFCQELEELWALRDLLGTFTQQLAGQCVAELLPLMDISAIKKGRARMLFDGGFQKVEDVAKALPEQLVAVVEHLNLKTASQIINSARMLLIEKVELLQQQAEEVLMGLGRHVSTLPPPKNAHATSAVSAVMSAIQNTVVNTQETKDLASEKPAYLNIKQTKFQNDLLQKL